MKIHKYPLHVTDLQDIKMPPGAQMLSVQVQRNTVCLWALVNDTKPASVNYTIAIYGTGNPMPDEPGSYIGTFQLNYGGLVFHAFMLKTEPA